MQCKKALEEANGDAAKALIILQKKSKEAASKKADRTLGAGCIESYIHSTGTVGVMVELACETDFVSNNEEFKKLTRDIAMHIAATNPEFIRKEDISEEAKKAATDVFEEEVKGKPENLKAQILEGKVNAFFQDKILLEQPFVKNPELTIQALIDGAVQKFGEKMELVRFVRFAVGTK
jgi:elongation factor Ts